MEWISVKDRLPSDGEMVLCLSIFVDGDNKHRLIKYGSIPSGFPSDVTHWMPLPPNPKD